MDDLEARYPTVGALPTILPQEGTVSLWYVLAGPVHMSESSDDDSIELVNDEAEVPAPEPSTKRCIVPLCQQDAVCRDKCITHYRQRRRASKKRKRMY